MLIFQNKLQQYITMHIYSNYQLLNDNYQALKLTSESSSVHGKNCSGRKNEVR